MHNAGDHVILGQAVVGIGSLSIVGYLILQPLLAFRFTGKWRIAALVPLLATVPLIVQAAVAAATGSNLWPILLIFFMPCAFLYLLLLAALHWWMGRAAARSSS
jgi:uncharacterized membrane protein (GlpM family)